MADARLRLTGMWPGRAGRAGRASDLGKRLFDVVLGSACLLMLFPLLATVAVLVRLTTPGPVIFRQTRLGRDRRPFTFYKFRTMYDGCGDEVHKRYVRRLITQDHPPAGGPRGLYKLEGDARITPLGRVLRQLSIDELPQLINVLLGDMSLVGPRPLPGRDYDRFDQDWQRRRFSVRPGITCLWQVKGRSSIGFDEWMKLDLNYIDQWSIWLDLEILIKTVPAVLRGSGAV